MGKVQGTGATIAQISQQCLTFNGVACRSCEDHCDVDAIRFKPQIGGHYTPQITKDCTSCNACVGACPISAIELVPIRYHTEFTHED